VPDAGAHGGFGRLAHADYALRHRVARIEAQVEEDLFELGAIGAHYAQAAAGREIDLVEFRSGQQPRDSRADPQMRGGGRPGSR